MGFLKKVFVLALIAAVIYLIYAKIIKPMVEGGKDKVGNFYGTTSLPNPE